MQVKTQIQAQSNQTIAVGHQHNHSNSWSAFKNLWKQGGFKSLYRGWYANNPRAFIGSATQLTTFSLISDYLKNYEVSPSLLNYLKL